MLCSVRGAISVGVDSQDAIRRAVTELMDKLMAENAISHAYILNVIFTITHDLSAMNPALALREHHPAWAGIPLLCAQEPNVIDALPRIIRVLIQWQPDQTYRATHPVYLGEARHLRSDLAKCPPGSDC